MEKMMKCDCCNLENFHAILILRKRKFLKGSRTYGRICLSCARKLAHKGNYRFGIYWSSFLLSLKGVW